jgi:acyl-CoA synthetase (AMP-forming)/AMP-acid ligase II
MNIASILDLVADALGDRRAVGDLTYEQLREAAMNTSSRIEGLDPAAKAMATILPNGVEFPIALFGSAWAGVSFAPLNFRLPEFSRQELLERIQPAIMFDKSWINDPRDDALESYPDDPVNPAVLLFTSGTSSKPKIAVLQHQNLMAYIFNTLEFASASEDEAVLLAVPPFHVAGVAAVLSATFVGRRIVPLAHFDASSWLDLACAERVTHAMVVPTMLARVVAELQTHPEKQPTALRSLAYGGARMPPSVLEQALKLLPDVDFVHAYGLTETSSTVAVLGPEDHRLAFASDDPKVRRRLGSCGRPVPGVEFTVREDELWIRGEQVGGSYVGAVSQIDQDGWLHTGDHGFVDDEGYVFISDRADDMIIRGGENISPAEVEDALLRHHDIAGAGVVGLPDVEWGDKIGALVVPRSGADLDVDQVRAWMKVQLGSLKTPEVIVVCDELPLGPTGKVLRRTIKEMLAD